MLFKKTLFIAHVIVFVVCMFGSSLGVWEWRVVDRFKGAVRHVTIANRIHIYYLPLLMLLHSIYARIYKCVTDSKGRPPPTCFRLLSLLGHYLQNHYVCPCVRLHPQGHCQFWTMENIHNIQNVCVYRRGSKFTRKLFRPTVTYPKVNSVSIRIGPPNILLHFFGPTVDTVFCNIISIWLRHFPEINKNNSKFNRAKDPNPF